MFNPYGMEQPSFGSSPIVAGDNPINLPIPKLKRGGMFGGVKIDPAAGIAGFLAGLGNPAGMQTLRDIHERRMYEQEQAAREQEYQQHRQDSYTDALNLYDYKAAHPDTPDITQRVAALNQIKPGLGDTYAQNYAQNGGGLGTIFKDPATGQSYAIGGGGGAAASSGPQPGAIEDGYRFKGGNPADPNAWEPVSGGAGGNVSSNFPGPY